MQLPENEIKYHTVKPVPYQPNPKPDTWWLTPEEQKEATITPQVWIQYIRLSGTEVEVCEEITDFASSGMSLTSIALHYGLSVEQLEIVFQTGSAPYKKAYDTGRMTALALTEKALQKKSIGGTYATTKKGIRGDIPYEEIVVREEPPSLPAIEYTLENMAPGSWKSKKDDATDDRSAMWSVNPDLKRISTVELSKIVIRATDGES